MLVERDPVERILVERNLIERALVERNPTERVLVERIFSRRERMFHVKHSLLNPMPASYRSTRLVIPHEAESVSTEQQRGGRRNP